MHKRIDIFDSTLRDGAQGENVSFSVEDKLNIVKELDSFGIPYIEAGNPGSNPKDLEFFRKVKELKLQNSKLCAFGSTRRKGITVEEDKNVLALLDADTDVIVIFGKSWDLHVEHIISATLEENLEMIYDTVSYFTAKGKTVFYDAEHFFDGYRANPDYALKTLSAAEKAGAKALVLCDTNGGMFPDEISNVTKIVIDSVKTDVGIHCHNDSGCAVANTIAAVKAGVKQVQGTFIGIGERCGNVNLTTIIAGLQLKLGYDTAPEQSLSLLTKTATYIAEIANMQLAGNMPYVGTSAFAHKGGMHVDGVKKISYSFEHVDPSVVGNRRNILLSEVAGRSAILSKLNEIDPTLTKTSPETQEIIDIIKNLEHKGYLFEAADASFEMLVLKHLGRFKPFFEIEHFRIISEQNQDGIENPANAMIKVKVGDKTEMTADEGRGPVNAIDKALRKALEMFYPSLKEVRLIDYKVRVMNTSEATTATTRVLIESTDGYKTWTTVGAGEDIINASVIALTDSIEYKLYTEYNKRTEE